MSENGETRFSAREGELRAPDGFDSDNRAIYNLPGGGSFVVTATDNEKVIGTRYSSDGSNKLDILSDADFAALIGDVSANQPSASETPSLEATAEPDEDREAKDEGEKHFAFGDMFMALSRRGATNIHVLGSSGDRLTVGIEDAKGQTRVSWTEAELASYLEREGAKFVENIGHIGVEQPPESEVVQVEPVVVGGDIPEESKEAVTASAEPEPEPIGAPENTANAVEPQPVDGDEDDPVEPVTDPVEPKQTAGEQISKRHQLEIMLGGLKVQYGRMDESTEEAQNLLRDITRLEKKLATDLPADLESEVAPEPEKKTREELYAELQHVNADLKSVTDEKSPEAKALKARAKELNEMIGADFAAEYGEESLTERERLGLELEEVRSKLEGLDENSKEAKDLKRRIGELHKLIAADFEKEMREDDDPEEPRDPAKDKAARKLRKEREKEVKEQKKSIDQEMRSTKLFEKYRKALNAYGELKANHDTKNPLFPLAGRYKREQALLRAEKELIKTKQALARETIDRRKQAGLYSGEDELEMKQAMSDDLFDEIRKIDPDTRRLTSKILEERQEHRNPLQKLAIGFGRFLNRGEKASLRYAKNAGTGVAVGIAKGAALGFFGAGWPVSAALIGAGSVGVSVAARYGSKMAYLDDALKTHTDKKGKAIPQLSNKQYKKLIDSYKDGVDYTGKKTENQISDRLARAILSGSREAGAKERDEAKKKAAKNMAAFGLGMAAGGFGARAVHDLWGALHPALPTGSGSPSAATVVPHPNEGTSPNVRYPEVAPQAASEVTPTIDNVPIGHVNLGGAKFPWNYAANHVGASGASAELQSRAAQAATRGHNVQWYRTINGSQALRIDGSDKTQDVIDVLWGNK